MNQRLKFMCLHTVIATVIGNLTVEAQPCNGEPSNIYGEEYAYRARENRCEGFVTREARNTRFRIANFSYGHFIYSLTPGEIIFLSSAQHYYQAVSISASSLKIKNYYRMDATLGSTSTLEWPVADVIGPKKIQPNDVGVMSLFQRSPTDTLWVLPVRFTTKSKTAVLQKDRGILKLLVLRDLKNIQYTIYSISNQTLKKIQTQTKTLLREGYSLEIVLPSTIRPGSYYIDILSYDRFPAPNELVEPKKSKVFLKV